MPDNGYITCECGYEIFVSEAQRGKVVECLHCGAENDTAVNIPGERSVVEIPAPPSREKLAPSSGSSSPFENEDDDEPIIARPTVPDAGFDETPPAPYAASAFEDDDEEEVVDNTPKPDPALIRNYHDPEHSNAYQNVQNAETCPNCGNPFRGDWDKQIVDGTTMCYICSNQATEKIPDRIIQKEAVRPNPITEQQGWSDSVNVAIPEGPFEEVPWYKDPESRGFRRMIYWMAFGLIAVTLIAVFTTDYSGPPQAPTSLVSSDTDGAAEQPALPQWATLLYWILVVAMRITGLFASIYLVLSLTNRLPSGDWKGDCITIAYCVFWLFLLSNAYFAVLYFASGMDPMSTLFTIIFATICGGFAAILIVMNVLDFRIRDFFYLAMISGPVHGFLTIPAAFLYTALANIAL